MLIVAGAQSAGARMARIHHLRQFLHAYTYRKRSHVCPLCTGNRGEKHDHTNSERALPEGSGATATGFGLAGTGFGTGEGVTGFDGGLGVGFGEVGAGTAVGVGEAGTGEGLGTNTGEGGGTVTGTGLGLLAGIDWSSMRLLSFDSGAGSVGANVKSEAEGVA